jgi:hypothetical protein
VSLTALTERIESDRAILPGRKQFLLMWTSGIVVDLENELLDFLDGEVGVMENREDEEH